MKWRLGGHVASCVNAETPRQDGYILEEAMERKKEEIDLKHGVGRNQCVQASDWKEEKGNIEVLRDLNNYCVIQNKQRRTKQLEKQG